MKSKLIHEENGLRTYAIVLDENNEVKHTLLEFAHKQKLGASHFTGIGSFRSLVIWHFDWSRKTYQNVPINEEVEVVVLSGDIAFDNNEPEVQAHVVVAKSNGKAYGGHLLEAHIKRKLEVIIEESQEHLRRKVNRDTGLAMLRI